MDLSSLANRQKFSAASSRLVGNSGSGAGLNKGTSCKEKQTIRGKEKQSTEEQVNGKSDLGQQTMCKPQIENTLCIRKLLKLF